MRKLLCVYNTCGIYGRPNLPYYIHALTNMLNQNFDDFRVVLSSCLNQLQDIKTLKNTFGNNMSYNVINDKLPISITFNKTVIECVKAFGEFQGYLFLDSGLNFINQPNILLELYNLFVEDDYGMVSARTNTDTGLSDWFNVGSHDNDLETQNKFFKQHGHFIIPVGKAFNLHAQIFSNKLLQFYKRLMPCVVAGQCVESLGTFLCAALHTKWVIHKDIVLYHLTGLDGPSSGFEPHRWEQSGRPRWDHPFIVDSIVDIAKKGQQYGCGWEELQSIVVHDPDKFDENGYAKDNRLKYFIRDNLFLDKPLFDYDKINYEFVP